MKAIFSRQIEDKMKLKRGRGENRVFDVEVALTKESKNEAKT